MGESPLPNERYPPVCSFASAGPITLSVIAANSAF
jgi:hypothetical protein